VSANAAGLFLLLFALVALTLTLAGGDQLGQAAYGLFFVSLLLMAIAGFADNDGLTKVGGWFAVAAGAVAWYAATAALAHWPTALPRRAAGRGVTATG
jgi:succinate-acetate transporter protein